jgi:hypothetical protein
VLWCILTALVISFAPQGLRAQAVDACGPSPVVKAALDDLPSDARSDQTEKQFREQKLARIQALLRQYPDDLFVQWAYIRANFQSGDRDRMIEEYKARHEQHPDNVESAYLYGMTLRERRTPEAIKLFESAIEKDSKFAWPHLSFVGIYTSPNFSNKEKAVAHIKSFLRLCPAAPEGYERLSDIDDRELLRQGAEKLRELLRTRSDPDAVSAYKTLWSLEFKGRPPTEYDLLRKQVGEDLQRIRALNLQDKRQWYEALEEGYRLVNDQKQSDWAREERQRHFPTRRELAERQKWYKDHPSPNVDDPPEKKKAYYRDLLKESAEWVKQRPQATVMWWDCLNAVKHLDDVPISEVVATLDKAFQVAEANADPQGPESRVFFGIAEVLSKKGIQPERLVEMARKGLEQLEVEAKEPQSDLYANKQNVDRMNFYRAPQRLQGLGFEIDGYLRLGQAEKAQAELAWLDMRLQEMKSLAGDKEGRKKECSSQEASYWGLMARLAELQNRKLDAMAYYENALLTRLQAGTKPETGEKDELADNALKLWNSLGGTEEGWKTWYARPAAELAAKSQLIWEKANEPLPSFELADLQGKTWRLADLKGKEILLNFWATW